MGMGSFEVRCGQQCFRNAERRRATQPADDAALSLMIKAGICAIPD
jgi:hypothetical protein